MHGIVRESFVVYLLVALSIALLDIVAALAVGLIASMVIFVRTMNDTVVRSVKTGAGIRSRRMYSPASVAALQEGMKRVAVVELEGALFFGTADRLAITVERLPNRVRFVLLDLRRVHALDVTAGAVLARVSARLRSEHRTLLLSGRTVEHEVVTGLLPAAFPDRDRALEWIEERLLEELAVPACNTPIEPARLGDVLGLVEDETARILAVARDIRHAAGESLFREGDPGDEIFFLLEGSVSILRADRGQHDARIVTFLPGNLFGDVAFIDRSPRSAHAVCETSCRILALSRAALESVADTEPLAVARVYAALAHNIAQRLRAADDAAKSEREG